DNIAPVFTTDSMSRVDATEDVAYTGQTLAGSATDVDTDLLTYSKVSGPVWLSVAADGALSGTPANDDIGSNAFEVKVSDDHGGTDTATLNITVLNVNDAPTFTVDPITGSDATADEAYSATIVGSATDVDSDPLTYSKVSGPVWLSVAADGTLSGTPANGDAGTNAFMVEVSDGNGGTDTTTLNITVVDPGAPVSFFASSESTVKGSILGSFSDTFSNNDIYETLTEVESGGKPSRRYSQLEHTWTFSVTGGELVTFYVEAHHTANSEGDDFIFAYSTDGASYTDMVTVTKTTDDNTAQFYVLPGTLSGTVYVRVLDTDHSQGNRVLDSLYVDALFVTSESASGPPTAATSPSPVNGATEQSLSTTLSWTAGTLAASHDVYFGTSATPAAQGNQSGTTFDPGALAASTVYYWAVDEVNAVGTTVGLVWSFTTTAGGAPLPGQASNPNPASGSRNIATTPTLSWTAGSDAASHNVYFGTVSGSPAFIGNQTGTTFSPG
ncbi:MAG: cadherin-like domain-containing protein, partial [Lentisphaeria bacterium]|nr:cadherin-like domain-containing protein [Lentisphaeria bacterium]